MKEHIREAVDIIRNSNHAVVFTGAGISVESGIPPFRGNDGIWAKYNPQSLELNYFLANPAGSWSVIKEIFYDYFGKYGPNKAHLVIAKWQKMGYIKSVITQNIDNLHQESGSKNVIEFHGNSQTCVCLSCNSKFSINEVDFSLDIPSCIKCKGILKPNFIFFGEGIPEPAGSLAFEEAGKSDAMIIVGTTGEVMPASLIPKDAKNSGAKIIEVNTHPTTYTDTITDVFLKGKATEMFKEMEKYGL